MSSGGTEYLTPERTKNYLGNGEILKENNIKVSFFNYRCKEYEQKNTDKFISHLSIVDLLFNFGKDLKTSYRYFCLFKTKSLEENLKLLVNFFIVCKSL